MTLAEALAAVVARRPNAIAIQDSGHRVSYAMLWATVGELSESLARGGIGAGTIVAIRTPRGWQQIVAICAVLVAGASYLPVDPAYPPAVQDYMLVDSTATAVIELVDGQLTVSALDPAEPESPPPGTAYLLYTSGSTGSPKGVLVGHEHVLALLRSCFTQFDVDEKDSWTMVHSCSFDFSVWELWACLLSGGRLVIVDQGSLLDPDAMIELVRDEGITVLSLVPSVFGVLLEALEPAQVGLAQLRYVVLGGEAINPTAVTRWAALTPTCQLVNMYGITETTVHSTFALLQPPLDSRDGSTPIGRPLPHVTIQVVDDELRPVPPGTVGEMLIGGASIAYGYWRRPELTADRFLAIEGQWHYRSGDRAYADEQGGLHFVGRADDQVKIRGHRIELAEVEAALREHPSVATGVCVVEQGPAARGILVANLIVTASAHDATHGELRTSIKQHLQQRLPAHAVPTRYRFRDSLPVTASGKVDRRSLASGQ